MAIRSSKELVHVPFGVPLDVRVVEREQLGAVAALGGGQRLGDERPVLLHVQARHHAVEGDAGPDRRPPAGRRQRVGGELGRSARRRRASGCRRGGRRTSSSWRSRPSSAAGRARGRRPVAWCSRRSRRSDRRRRRSPWPARASGTSWRRWRRAGCRRRSRSTRSCPRPGPGGSRPCPGPCPASRRRGGACRCGPRRRASNCWAASISACFSAGVSGIGSREKRGSRSSTQSTGLELPVPRGSQPTMSKWSSRSSLKARVAWSTSDVPGTPGPPGFTSSDPMRSLPLAGRRFRVRSMVPFAGIGVVERDRQRGALEAAARLPVERAGGGAVVVAPGPGGSVPAVDDDVLRGRSWPAPWWCVGVAAGPATVTSLRRAGAGAGHAGRRGARATVRGARTAADATGRVAIWSRGRSLHPAMGMRMRIGPPRFGRDAEAVKGVTLDRRVLRRAWGFARPYRPG